MPPSGVRKRACEEILSFEEIIRFVQIVKRSFDLSKVHITGGEPLVRPGVADLVAMLAEESIPDLALTTNGLALTAMAADLWRAGLRRVNVSLQSLRPDRYAEMTRGGDLRHALAGIDAARAAGFAPVKINAIILRGYNDAEIADLATFAVRRGCPIRFLELMPIGPARAMWSERFMPAGEIQARIEETFRLEPLPYALACSSRDFRARSPDGTKGVVGFVASQTRPFCNGCARLRLTSTGEIIGCLSRGRGAPIRELLASGDAAGLNAAVERMLATKRLRPEFRSRRIMARVGG
jgi:cyclic pyranopterin phosphate synthase